MAEHDVRSLLESVPHVSAREFLRVFLVAIGIIMAVNTALCWRFRYASPNDGYRLLIAKWDLLTELDHPVDWLILGDSSGNQGVVPTVLGQRLGGRGLNLCTVGNALVVNDSWMLETYLARFGPPRGVVLVRAYDTWRRRPKIPVLAQIPQPWGYWEHLAPPIRLNWKQGVGVFLHRHVPLYSANYSIRLMVHYLHSPEPEPFSWDAQGFTARPHAKPEAVDEDADGHQRSIRSQPFELSAKNREALEHILKRGKELGFPVYVVHGPLYADLYTDPAVQNYLSQVHEVISGVTTAVGWGNVLLYPPATFSKEELETVDHLTLAGAERYTAHLAEAIARAPN